MGHFLSFGTTGRPLKFPILHDRLSKATEVGIYPKSEHVQVFVFSFIYLAHLGLSTILIVILSIQAYYSK